MQAKFTRRRSIVTATSAVAAAAFVRFPGEAAEFEYKLSHALQVTHPVHIRFLEMWKAVRDETNGRLNVTVFPNGEIGGDDAALGQMRAGAIQFVCEIGATFASVVPAAAIESVGFAFKSAAEGLAAVDGPLGDYVRQQVLAQGIVGYPTVMDIGMRQLSSRVKPIITLADYQGFKLRVPTSKIVTDLFSTLGASPTPLPGTAIYSSLQTHVVDGDDVALPSIQSFKLYEVQKYVTMTNHLWVGYWLLGNLAAVTALPPDIRANIIKNNHKYALLQRQDIAAEIGPLKAKLESEGMIFADVPTTAPLRAKLAPYYARWKNEFGATAWALLEKTTGKLG